MASKTQPTKAEIDKQAHIKPKTFCTAKERVNKIKRQPIEWDEMFAKHISDKGLISKICKEHLQLNRKPKKPDFKMGKAFELTFLQRKHTRGQQVYEGVKIKEM